MPKRSQNTTQEEPPTKKRKLNSNHEEEKPNKRINKTEKKRIIREKKEQTKPYYKTILEAKTLWEKFRPHNVSKKERMQLIDKALSLLKGNIVMLSNSSDVSRIVQSAFQLGTIEHREMIFEEVKPHIVHMSENQYSLHILKKILYHGTQEQKKEVLDKFIGNVEKMLPKKGGVKVLDYYYTEVANAKERNLLLQELWGKEFTTFKQDTAHAKSLESVLAEQPEKRSVILPKLRNLTSTFLQKGVINYTITQVLILEFLKHCTQNDASEVIEKLEDGILQIMHTKEGSAIGVYSIAYATPKHKKFLIKRVKQHLMPTLEDSRAHMFICALLAYTDDTVLLNKTILKGMRKNLLKIATNVYSRRALAQILCPKGTRYFAPNLVELLSLPPKPYQKVMFKEGDQTYQTEMVSQSKKPDDVRTKELQNFLKDDLVKLVKSHTQELLTSDPGKDILVDIFKAIPESRSHCFNALQPILTNIKKLESILDKRPVNFALKRLITEKVDDFDFAKNVAKTIQGKVAKIALIQGGAFLLYRLVSEKSSSKLVFKELKPIMDQLKKAATKEKGASVLVKSMESEKVMELQNEEDNEMVDENSSEEENKSNENENGENENENDDEESSEEDGSDSD